MFCFTFAFIMSQISCKNLLIINVISLFLHVSHVTCTLNSIISLLKDFYNFKVALTTSVIERIPKVTRKGLRVDITLDNILEYEAGVKTGDKDLNITQLIEKYGYTVETHNLETIDNYILKIFRMLGKKQINGTVVLLEHGLLSSSDDWVTAGPNVSLAYLLADNGYDVWLGNARGNKHCQENVNLTVDDDKFWDFSWDEIGRYDLPAIIDYVLSVTGKEQLMFIGHSQGTTAFFVMASERPEYNKKVSYMVALAAIAWLSYTTSPIFEVVSPIAQEDNLFIRTVLGPAVYENYTVSGKLFDVVCEGSLIQNVLCNNLLFLLLGFDNAQINFKALATITSHLPGGAATKQLEHYAQSIVSGKFRRFDYKTANLVIYGSKEPPDYPVDKITVPMAIYYGKSDWVTEKKDVDILMYHLKNNFTFHTVPYESFTHTDFLFAKDARALLYNNVLENMNSYRNNN